MSQNKIATNTIMLYLMTFAKMIFPLITLPYLTRVLSVDGYAVVAYVKSAMAYMQIIIDFGFLLSAIKDIVKVSDDKNMVSKILGETLQAKILLAIIAFIVIFITTIAIPMLRENLFYTMLAYFSVALTILLPDFLFRGIEQMQAITIRFIIMRGIATALTFVVIKGDSQLLLIPVLDIIGTIAAIIWTWFEIHKLGYKMIWVEWKTALTSLKKSFIYFLSDASTTVFGALNTLLIGIYLTKTDVAYWSVAMQLISAVIDADMRKPVQHNNFKVTNSDGLSTLIIRKSTMDKAIKNDIIQNLDLLTSGSIPPNPSELLASENYKKLLDELSQKYDYIIIDTPPINVVSDAMVMKDSISGILLVIRYASTTYEELSSCMKQIELAQANMLGFVMNDIHHSRSSSYYNYKYKYKYKKYGYGHTPEQSISTDVKEENKNAD